MCPETNKAVVRRWLLEGVNNFDVSAIEECNTSDFVNHGTTKLTGYEAARQVLFQMQDWAPDRKIKFIEMVAEGDTVMVLFAVEGTHTGALRGVEPTGRRFRFVMADVFRLRDGKICESWVIRDRLEAQEQLGLVHGASASR
jgi:predicted ester cyclase